jgi:phospholipid transport system transporter-binding protein
LAEAFRSVRSALLFSKAGKGLKNILITSPMPSEGKTLNLTGDLVIGSVASLLKQANSLFSEHRQVTIDFKEVPRVDSAGLALLLEWVEWARDNDARIQFRNVPDALIRIARLSNVEEMLPLE